jgi:hypothetical protein
MTAPDACTSLTCLNDPATGTYCPECSHAMYIGRTTDGRYHWEFNPRFGPEFWNRRGRPVNDPRAALWREFEAWHSVTFPKTEATI